MQSVKECNVCHVIKTLDMYHKDAGKKDGYRTICKDCTKQRTNAKASTIILTEKKCSKCQQTKPVSEFHKDKKKPDGYQYMCKECNKMQRQSKVPTITKKICVDCKIEKDISCFNKNNANNDGYHHRCSPCRIAFRKLTIDKEKAQYKKYYHRPEIKQRYLEYRNLESTKQRILEWRMNPNVIEHQKQYRREKYRNDLSFKLSRVLRSRLHKVLNGVASSHLKLLGCDLPFLIKWLQYRFDDKMTWDNYGTYWHIDHIIPINAFNLLNEIEQKLCCHWTNLQPLTAFENMQKHDKLELHHFFNNIVNVYRFYKLFDKFNGYQVLNESLRWLRTKTSGMVKIPSMIAT